MNNMMSEFLSSLDQEMQDLEYQELLLLSELKNCDNQQHYELAHRELVTVRVKLRILKDINGVL